MVPSCCVSEHPGAVPAHRCLECHDLLRSRVWKTRVLSLPLHNRSNVDLSTTRSRLRLLFHVRAWSTVPVLRLVQRRCLRSLKRLRVVKRGGWKNTTHLGFNPQPCHPPTHTMGWSEIGTCNPTWKRWIRAYTVEVEDERRCNRPRRKPHEDRKTNKATFTSRQLLVLVRPSNKRLDTPGRMHGLVSSIILAKKKLYAWGSLRFQ